MIQRRRSRLKPARIIRRRTGYPGLCENIAYGSLPNSVLNNGNAPRIWGGGQANSQYTALWAGPWPR